MKKRKKRKKRKEDFDSWLSDQSDWIRGIFYFNKKDKPIFPPKRIVQLGWIVNFANPIYTQLKTKDIYQ